MKSYICILVLSLLGMTSAYSSSRTDVYDMKLVLSVPRVYDNTQSLGSRKIQTQTITGTVSLTYETDSDVAVVEYSGFTNLTHKLSSGSKVTYDVMAGDCNSEVMSAIGNNKTKVFSTVTACFDLIFEPNYALGEIPTEDNSLYVKMSSTNGRFKNKNGRKLLSSMSGYVAGTIGCACSEYGHISPTRAIGYSGPLVDQPVDIAAVKGKWIMKYNSQKSR